MFITFLRGDKSPPLKMTFKCITMFYNIMNQKKTLLACVQSSYNLTTQILKVGQSNIIKLYKNKSLALNYKKIVIASRFRSVFSDMVRRELYFKHELNRRMLKSLLRANVIYEPYTKSKQGHRQSLNRTLSLQHLYNKNQITFKNILNINFLDIWFMVSLINL